MTLWDARTLQPAGALRGLSTTSHALAFSPDGSLLAAAGRASPPDFTDGNVRVWDVRRRALTPVRFALSSGSVAFSPDGTLLAAAALDGPSEIRDPRTGRLVARIQTPGQGRSLAFSPDGTRLATGHQGGTALLWSTRSWKPVGPGFEGHGAERFLSMHFTPDGQMLVTSGSDGTVRLHDVNTGNPIGTSLIVEPDALVATALSPNGSRLFAVSDRRGGLRFDISPQAWKRHACLVAGRDLTSREWRDSLPRQPKRTICRPA